MVEINGLNQLGGQLEDAIKALEALGSELGSVNFNPHDPASIEAAIKQIESVIDDRIGIYASNPIVAPLVEQLKENYRQGIIERADAARLSENQE